MNNKIKGKKAEDILDLSETSLNDGKAYDLLHKVYYSDVSKFSLLIHLTNLSKGTVSKYLNKLEEEGMVYREKGKDREVDWKITEKGKLYLIKKDWFKDEKTDPEKFEERMEKVRDYIESNEIKKIVARSDIEDAVEKFNFFEPIGNKLESEKDFLRIFTDVDLDKYEYVFKRKD